MAVSSLIHSSPKPSSAAKRSARTSGVKPAPRSTGASSLTGQEVPVAPDRARTMGDPLPADGGGDLLVVVRDLERPEAVIADVECLGGERPRTFPTTQPSDKIDHRSSSSIGHWHLLGPGRGVQRLPRRQRARPSVALDDVGHGSSSPPPVRQRAAGPLARRAARPQPGRVGNTARRVRCSRHVG